MPSRADFVVSPQLLHSWQKRFSLPALTTSLLLMVLGILLLGMTGCGVSSTPPDGSSVAVPPPVSIALKKGNIFTPTALPLSPNSAGEANDVQPASPSNKEAKHPGTFSVVGTLDSPPSPAPAPTINNWFYLVNGTWFQNQDPSTSPVPVLTASGTTPNGAPNPNGGMGVSVVPMAPTGGPTQLWKAVSWNGNVFLRSAESFKTYLASGGSGGAYPSPLTGFERGGLAYLDLGYDTVTSSLPINSSQQLGLFLNQSGSPTGDQSAFQQWSYNSYAMLENMNTGLYIWDH
jgi:hypothetical protein